jgi:Holliday junction resolvase RusA-like endonuclease
MTVIVFRVRGIPRPGGSKRAFYRPGMKHAVITEDCKRSKDWRQDVKAAALAAWSGPPLTTPLRMDVRFIVPRPQSHYRTGRRAAEIRESAPYYCTKRPDATKLMRSTEDALTGILWRDDSQVVYQTAQKVYGEQPGAEICVGEMLETKGNTA